MAEAGAGLSPLRGVGGVARAGVPGDAWPSRWDFACRSLAVALLAVASACSTGEGSGTAPSEARFSEVSDGILHDAQTGLSWTARDADRELSWRDAHRHCAELALGGEGAAWRLPTIDELAALYDASQQQPCGDDVCHIDAAFGLSSAYQWSDTSPSEERRSYFDFRFGTRLAPRIRPALTRRALCTRATPPPA